MKESSKQQRNEAAQITRRAPSTDPELPTGGWRARMISTPTDRFGEKRPVDGTPS